MNRTFALAFLLAVTPAAWSQEKTIDNPAYASWAKQKVGTTMTQKMVNEVAGTKSETTMIYKVLEVKPDKVVVELISKSKVMGMEFEAPAQKMDIEKTVKIDPKAQEAAEKAKAKFTTTTGEETLKVGGKEYKCKWTKVKGTTDGVEYESTTWTSDDMPNTMVKMTSKSTGKDASMTSTTVMEVTEIKIP